MIQFLLHQILLIVHLLQLRNVFVYHFVVVPDKLVGYIHPIIQIVELHIVELRGVEIFVALERPVL